MQGVLNLDQLSIHMWGFAQNPDGYAFQRPQGQHRTFDQPSTGTVVHQYQLPRS
jgi:hypothetical protein